VFFRGDYLAKVNQCPAEQILSKLTNKSSYELGIFQQQLPVKISTQGSLLLSWFLIQIALSRKLTSDLASDLAQAIKLDDDLCFAQGIMAFAELLPVAIFPGLLVKITDDELLMLPMAQISARIVECLPEMPIALGIAPEHFSNCTSEGTEWIDFQSSDPFDSSADLKPFASSSAGPLPQKWAK
jgi:hypothetical protein